MALEFYSARLLHIAVVGGIPRRRKHLCDETVFVFRAKNETDAFRQALKLGAAHEHEYRNQYRQVVRWAFAEVVAIKRLGKSLAVAEVSSRLYDRVLPKAIALRKQFHPERSSPQWS
jgi:hypothetical protein